MKINLASSNRVQLAPLSRRGFMAGSAAMCVSVASPALAKMNFDLMDARSLSLIHVASGEEFKGTYYENGAYLPDAMAEIDFFMRDHNVDQSIMMDVRLIDLLAKIQHDLGLSNKVQITSGYRTQKTNDRLRSRSERAARNSLHIQGMAADFYIPGFSARKLANVAQKNRMGGVGTYNKARFVHVDVGPVRRWHT